MEQVTKEYLNHLTLALGRGADFGLTRKPLVGTGRVSEGIINKAFEIIEGHLPLITGGLPSDISTHCFTLSARAFTTLNFMGVPSEIVIGTTYWQGQCIFPCDAESLRQELMSPGDENTPIKMHAWVSLGGDAVIDMTLPQFLVKNCGAPDSFLGAIVANRVERIKRDGIEYEPIIVGSEYLGKTNPPDPILTLNELKARASLRGVSGAI